MCKARADALTLPGVQHNPRATLVCGRHVQLDAFALRASGDDSFPGMAEAEIKDADQTMALAQAEMRAHSSA